MKIFFVFTLLCLLVAQINCQSNSSWAIIDNDFETIAMATSFYADEMGYVAGGTASATPLLLLTTDGGVTFTNQNLIGNNHAAFLSIDMFDSKNGVAGALGFVDIFACGAFTHDGQNWNSTRDDFVCTFQDAQAVDENNLILFGEWFDVTDTHGNGMMISSDGGNSWKEHNWNMGSSEAHYGWFANGNYGYVTGGLYPSTSSLSHSPHLHHLTSHLLFDKERRRYVVDTSPKDIGVMDEYIGMLALTTNGGSSFSPLLNLTGQGLYFNEISCTDQNNCWLAVEGVTKEGDAGWIYHTSNGWQTYDVQLTSQGSAIVAIDMISPTFGWAAGALMQGNTTGAFDGEFWLTEDGATWTLMQTIKNFFPFSISVTSESYAYSSGITPVGLSSFASYAPGN